jgi:hypothetical protein
MKEALMPKGNWITISNDDLENEIKYKFESHSPKKIKGIPWLVCNTCGLLYLRNPFTNWAIRVGCYSDYHSEYNKMRSVSG